MPSPRELPRDFSPIFDDGLSATESSTHVFLGHADYMPVNEYDALMRAAPHEEPETARADRLELRDPIADAIDELTEEEQWIFDAIFIRKTSLRILGRELSIPKTTVARKRDALLEKLRTRLSANPAIAAYLTSLQP